MKQTNKNLVIGILITVALVLGYFGLTTKRALFTFSSSPSQTDQETEVAVDQATRDKFIYLSQNGNSSCSSAFRNSIDTMADNERCGVRVAVR